MKSNLTNNDKGKIGFYILHNPDNDKVYVGSGDLCKRKNYHTNALENNRHFNRKLQHAYNKNPNFEFIGCPIECHNTSIEKNREISLKIEQSIIDEFKGNNLFLNIASNVTAPMAGLKHRDDVKAKMSISKIGKTNNYIRTPEIKQKISESLKTKYHSGFIHPNKNKPMSDEQKQQLSVIVKQQYMNGRVPSNLGVIRSKEFCEKISQTKKQQMTIKEKERLLVLAKIGGQKAAEIMKTPVKCDGVIYPSLNAACDVLNIHRTTVRRRINNSSDKFSDWSYVNK